MNASGSSASAPPSAQDEASTLSVAWARIANNPRRLFWIKLVSLAALTLVVILLRRPDQFAAPYVWVEDGSENLRDFLAHGWGSLWHPISGYFSVPIKFVHALSMTLSFRWLPEISLILTLLFCYGVLAAVAFAPTALRWPFSCAVAVLLIPTDAEAFGVSLYVGWWGTLLVLVALLWNTEKRRNGWRTGLLAIGALSSPLVVGIAPLFVIRALLLRRRGELITSGVALLLAAVQWMAISRARIGPGIGVLSSNIGIVVERFFGFFLDSSDRFTAAGGVIYLGCMLAMFLAVTWLGHRRQLGLVFVLLALALGAAIAASISRVSVDAIHPIYGGPRYFFFPYILLSWMLLQIAALDRTNLRLMTCVLLAMAFRNTLDGGRRTHGSLDWRAEIERCLDEPNAQLRIHFAGDVNNVWRVNLSREDCAELVRRSWFDNKVTP